MAQEPLKNFIRQKLDEGMPSEELSMFMKRAGIDTGILQEVLDERSAHAEQAEAPEQEALAPYEKREQAVAETQGEIIEKTPDPGAQAESQEPGEQVLVEGHVEEREEKSMNVRAEEIAQRIKAQQPRQKTAKKPAIKTETQKKEAANSEKKPCSKRVVFVLVFAVITIVALAIAFLLFGPFLSGSTAPGTFGLLDGYQQSNQAPKFSAYGLKQIELKQGTVTGYYLDQNHSFFELIVAYGKTTPVFLDLNSIRISKPGISCNTAALQEFSRMAGVRKTAQGVFALDRLIELNYGQTARFYGVIGGENCGMTQMDYNFNITLELAEKESGKKIIENCGIQGTYARLLEKDLNYYQGIGYYAWQTKEYNEAEKNYLEALKLEPESKGLGIQLVLMFFDANEMKKAADYIGSTIEKDANSAELQYYGGLANAQIGQYEKARSYFSNVLELDPKNFYAMDGFLKTYIDANQHNEGLLAAGQMSEKYPEESTPYYYIGVFSQYLGEKKKAEEAIKKAHELNPKDYYAINWLAALYFKDADYADLESLMQDVIKIFPEDALFLYYLGTAQYKQGKTAVAIANLEKSVEINPKMADAWLQLFYCYEKTNQRDKMTAAIKKYNELTKE